MYVSSQPQQTQLIFNNYFFINLFSSILHPQRLYRLVATHKTLTSNLYPKVCITLLRTATMNFDKEFLIVLFLLLSLFLTFLFYTSHAIFYGIPVVFLGIVLLYFSLPNESRKIKYRKKID